MIRPSLGKIKSALAILLVQDLQQSYGAFFGFMIYLIRVLPVQCSKEQKLIGHNSGVVSLARCLAMSKQPKRRSQTC